MVDEVEQVLAPDPEKSDRLLVVVVMKLKSMSLPDQTISQILRRAGLPTGAMDDFQFRLRFSLEMEILLDGLRIAAQGKPLTFALFAALPGVGVDNFGTIGLAMKHAPSLLEAVKSSYGDLIFTWAHTRLLIRRTGGQLILGFLERSETGNKPGQNPELPSICTAFDIITLLRVLQDIGGAEFDPDLVRFPFPAPENCHLFTEMLPVGVEYSADRAELVFPAEMADRRPRQSDPYLYRIFRAQTDQTYTKRPLISDVEQVEHLLVSRTPPPTRAEIAAQMGMTERNLSRRLSGASTSYRLLWVKVQYQQARRLLLDTRLSVSDVAYTMGYSDPSAFTRAFSSWAGQSPSDFRGKIGTELRP